MTRRAIVWAAAAALAGLVILLLMMTMIFIPAPKAPSLALGGGEADECSVAEPGPGQLASAGVAAIAWRAGWRGTDINIAVAVARAESGWNPKITNRNNNGSIDYGLFQINSIHEAILAGGNWADAQQNAAMAFKVWTDAGGSWGPWVTYWSGAYRQYLTDADVQPVCVQPVVAACAAPSDLDQYANGRIPTSALCSLWADRDHRLRSDAAGAFDALARAYFAHFGSRPCITDSYRSLAAQIDVYRRKPGLAAHPGTSNHGWGLALDLGCGLQIPGSAQDVWMHANAPRFGWVHPAWAEPGGSKPEAWHWAYPAKGHRP